MDVGHRLRESDSQTAEGPRCHSMLEHVIENGESECSFFTTNTYEAKWRPTLNVNGQQIKYDPNPKFLGITYDRRRIFFSNASIVGSKMKQQAGALRCLASTGWDYEKSILRSTYVATRRSTVECASEAWLPWVSLSTMKMLEEQSPDKSRRFLLKQFQQKPTFQPLLLGPHSSAP